MCWMLRRALSARPYDQAWDNFLEHLLVEPGRCCPPPSTLNPIPYTLDPQTLTLNMEHFLVGPGSCCWPRHSMPVSARIAESKCLG